MTFEIGRTGDGKLPLPLKELPLADEGPEPTRKCGDCRACCTALGVPDLDPPKPENEQCGYAGRGRVRRRTQKGGCSIYDERPQSCRDYNCYWRFGMGKWTDRPDKVGIIVDATEDLQRVWGTLAVHVREVWPGGSTGNRAKAMIESMSAGAVFVLKADGPRKFVTADPTLQAQFDAIKKRHLNAQASVVEALDFERDFSEEG